MGDLPMRSSIGRAPGGAWFCQTHVGWSGSTEGERLTHMVIEQVRLGVEGPWVGIQGFGAMDIGTSYYGQTDEAEARATLDRALELGVTLSTPRTPTVAVSTRSSSPSSWPRIATAS
jgi:hypothetical protein